MAVAVDIRERGFGLCVALVDLSLGCRVRDLAFEKLELHFAGVESDEDVAFMDEAPVLDEPRDLIWAAPAFDWSGDRRRAHRVQHAFGRHFLSKALARDR